MKLTLACELWRDFPGEEKCRAVGCRENRGSESNDRRAARQVVTSKMRSI